jgi:hypothetical protein
MADITATKAKSFIEQAISFRRETWRDVVEAYHATTTAAHDMFHKSERPDEKLIATDRQEAFNRLLTSTDSKPKIGPVNVNHLVVFQDFGFFFLMLLATLNIIKRR